MLAGEKTTGKINKAREKAGELLFANTRNAAAWLTATARPENRGRARA